MPGMTTKTSTVRLPDELKSRLFSVCEHKNMTQTDAMIEAIQSWVENHEKRIRLYEEAKRAHEHYLTTGLHVTNQEVAEWIARLRKNPKAEPPKCHR